ncbi:MAG: hypothetical protein HYZ42_00970 [Bacteroidetes bacterium]|nr:hypothetical protein [Bacteroidota bacterium]
MNNSNKNIDDVFNQGLNGMEEPFEPKAWEQMLDKLEQDEKKFIAPIPVSKKFNTKLIIIMTTSSLVLAALLYTFSPSNKSEKMSKEINTQTAEASIGQSNTQKNSSSKSSKKNSTASTSTSSSPQQKALKSLTQLPKYNPPSGNKKMAPSAGLSINSFNQKYTENLIENLAPKATSFNAMDLNFDDSIPDAVEKVLGKPKKKYRYNGPWIGIHFAFAAPVGDLKKQGYRYGWGGNMELMSGDLIKNKHIGAFLGGGFGVMYHGGGNDNNVLLQTPNHDSGYTYLYNMNFNFDMMARFEFGNYRLKPYVDFMLGARAMNTYQRIDSRNTIQGFEATDLTSHTAWGMHWGGSLGLRYHLVPGISLDGRVSYYSGDNFNWVDLKKSTYNQSTTNFNLNTHSTNLDMLHFRLGFLFELNEIRWNVNDGYSSSGYQNSPSIGGGGGNRGSGGSAPKSLKIQGPQK